MGWVGGFYFGFHVTYLVTPLISMILQGLLWLRKNRMECVTPAVVLIHFYSPLARNAAIAPHTCRVIGKSSFTHIPRAEQS